MDTNQLPARPSSYSPNEGELIEVESKGNSLYEVMQMERAYYEKRRQGKVLDLVFYEPGAMLLIQDYLIESEVGSR